MNRLVFREEHSLPVRNFREEIRGPFDVKRLLKSAVYKFQTREDDLSAILKGLFVALAEKHPLEYFDLSRFQREIFAEGQHIEEQPRLRHVIQGATSPPELLDASWIVTYCELEGLNNLHLGIATLPDQMDFGPHLEGVSTIVLVVGPVTQDWIMILLLFFFKTPSKSAREAAISMASILADDGQQLEQFYDDISLKESWLETSKRLASIRIEKEVSDDSEDYDESEGCWYPGRAIQRDFRHRWNHYLSDYLDGVKDIRSFSKVISSAVFLVFTILPTSIAYGMLNDDNTNGMINVQKVVLGQWLGGLIFGMFGGQPLLIVTTTAPLSIYISVIFNISQTNGYNFYSMYGAVGIWAQIFLIIYALFQVADLMKFTKRSTEEIFGIFIACTLTYKAILAVITTYIESYAECDPMNSTETFLHLTEDGCSPSSSLLFVVLVAGTFWISMSLSSFRSSSYLHSSIRDLVADYALPLAVVLMALVSYFLFYNVQKPTFNIYDTSNFNVLSLSGLPVQAHLIALGLGFPLSLLFLMDQLLVTNTIDNKQHNLQKGSAYHWDLLIVGLLNILLSVFGLPWMHGALPSAYLHLKALSDVEDKLHNGIIQPVIVNVRETRLAVLLAHILMIPIYYYLIPVFTKIFPTSIFHGLFLFMAVSSLTGNEFWERVLLIFKEPRLYPAAGYLRRVPRHVVHLFTIWELAQLAVLLLVGFYPYHYVEMTFPVVIALFIPLRQFILPIFFKNRHLRALDSEH